MHTVTITAPAGNAVTILGIDYFLNDDSKGVHLYNAGHAGIRADQLKLTGNTDHSLQSIAARTPDFILCDLWFNDTGAQTQATYIANLTQLRSDVNAECAAWGIPAPVWIQLIPYAPAGTRYIGDGTRRYPDDYYSALKSWADADTSGPGGSSGIYLLDCSRLMPRTDATASGLYDADGVHYVDAGAAKWAAVAVDALPLNRSSL